MTLTVVVDANIILSALLGGKPSSILFDSRFKFVTAKFTMEEVIKYIPFVSKKLDIPEETLVKLLGSLPIFVYQKKFYKEKLKDSRILIEHIDKKDVEILALALKSDTFLWSQDKDFEKCGYIKILKTHNFLF